MSTTIRQYTIAGFRDYLRGYKARGAVLYATFLHHTWSPNASQYRGLSTVQGIRCYHMSNGWSDIACHCYTAPDGTVFNGRPPTVMNCACQYPHKPWSALPASLRNLISATRGRLRWDKWPNAYGWSTETIGNFDDGHEDPTTSRAMATSLDVIAEVHRLWNIPPAHCYGHRDVEYKSCPGSGVDMGWVRDELRRRLDMSGGVKVMLGDVEIDCDVAVEDETARCALRPLAEALGYTVDGSTDWPTIHLAREEQD